MKNLKKNLQAVNRELKALAKKVDRLVVAVGKLAKPKVAKKQKAKAVKRKPVKKTVEKKVAAKKRAVKKVAAKKPATKKTTKTVFDTVLAMIRRSKKGVNTAALMKKTGFSEKQIHNNVYKLKKQGKVKSVGRGVYVKA